jgi:MinD-like ATPase involved in chromosome partitioning or flagellar assembly
MIQPRGQIITFYSYKGGTGRSMALANIACILAERQSLEGGQGVLMIDWDLEAPGLHRYFRNRLALGASSMGQLEDPIESRLGVIDLFSELDKRTDECKTNLTDTSSAATQMTTGEELARATINKINLTDYVIPTTIKNLYLLKAGRSNAADPNEYSERINRFGWEALYQKSPHLIRVFAEWLAEQYAYVLIDSRTGVTDISGICTMLLPEKVVVVFTPNVQSLTGGLELIRRATDYRRESADLRPLLVFPLVSRVEANEPYLRHDWRFGNEELGIVGYQPEMENVLREVYENNSIDLTGYFDDMQIQHIPRYAYGEEIAVLVEKIGDKFSLRRSYESFASKLVEPKAPWENAPPTPMTNIQSGASSTEPNTQPSRRTFGMVGGWALFVIAVTFGLVSWRGATRIPQAEIDAALVAFETAKAAGAADYAPVALQTAEASADSLKKVLTRVRGPFPLFRTHAGVATLARVTKAVSDTASAQANLGKERARKSAENAIASAKAAVDEALAMLATAPRGHEKEIDAMKVEFYGASNAIAEAEAAYQQGRYLEARGKAEIAMTHSVSVKSAVESATRFRHRPRSKG